MVMVGKRFGLRVDVSNVLLSMRWAHLSGYQPQARSCSSKAVVKDFENFTNSRLWRVRGHGLYKTRWSWLAW
jgi:hypothetical protein